MYLSYFNKIRTKQLIDAEVSKQINMEIDAEVSKQISIEIDTEVSKQTNRETNTKPVSWIYCRQSGQQGLGIEHFLRCVLDYLFKKTTELLKIYLKVHNWTKMYTRMSMNYCN